MSADGTKELEMLKRMCANLGAPEDQAEVMASQLLKRAGQLAKERGSSREDELGYLLDLIVAGLEGRPVEHLIRGSRSRRQGHPDPGNKA